MFGLGTWEILMILVAALVFIGPSKLPSLARTLGKGMRDVRRAMAGFEDEVRQASTVPPAPTPVTSEEAEDDPDPEDEDETEAGTPEETVPRGDTIEGPATEQLEPPQPVSQANAAPSDPEETPAADDDGQEPRTS